MEHLLEDELLAVMQYLDVPDLLACRLVCKRIGGLALHPHLWRHRRVSDYNCYCLPVLRLAPCLALLELTPREGNQDQLLYSTTRCAVSSLRLTVHHGSAMQAALLIRNQEVLGRLKNIEVTCWANVTLNDASASPLLWAVAFTSGLEKLAVQVYGPDDYLAISTTGLPAARPRSSLKYFRCGLRPELGPFRDFVLAAHADTMEEVNFEFNMFDSKALTSVASLLSGMRNLRRLYNCPLLPGMAAVAACESLERVMLVVGPGMRDAVPQAKEFLRRATQLRKVTIYFREDSVTGTGVLGAYMVLALLPSMPALRELKVLDTASEELLLAITPAAYPSLRTLKLVPYKHRCAHGFLHCDAAQTLLSRNPSLDLVLNVSYYCFYNKSCQLCKLGCHSEIWESEWSVDRKYEGVDDDPGGHWIHIPCLNLNPVPNDSIALP